MTAGPYRSSARPAQTVVRCCGMCDQAVGGCNVSIVFRRSAWKGGDYPAGVSARAPHGTRPLISADGGETWQDDEEQNHES